MQLYMRYFLIIIFILSGSISYAYNYDALLNKPFSERYRGIDTLFYTDRLWKLDQATAYKTIEDLSQKALKAKDDELYWELKLARIQYNTYNKIYSREQCIAALKELSAKVQEFDVLLLRVNFWISLYYYWGDEFAKAFEHQLKYVHLIKKLNYEQYPEKKNYLNHLGALYYSFEDYDMAKVYLKEAATLSLKNNHHEDIGINNTLGLVMRDEGKYDSALMYFNKVLQVARDSNKYWWISIVNGNIGIVYYLQGKYKEAVPLLKEDIDYALSDTYTANITNSIIKLADIYRMQGQYDSAAYYVGMARGHIVYGWSTYKHMVAMYGLLSKLAIHDGKKDLAVKYADSVAIAKDSVHRKRSLLLMAKTQRMVQEQKHKAELGRIVAMKEMSIRKRNNIIITLSLFAVIGVLFIYSQNNRRKKLRAEKELADSKLQSAQQRLSVFTNSLSEKNQLIENFSREIERLQALPCSNELPDTKENLAKLQNSILLTDEQWEDFKELFEQVHGGFLTRLKEKLPQLTPSEVRYMALSKLNLSNKEMANMLGIGLSGMRNYKYRLSKKIDLKEDEDLDQLVQNI